MIENERQYQVTLDREASFSQLLERMESGNNESVTDVHPAIRQAKLDATRSILQELREDIEKWESGARHVPAAP